MPGATYSSGVRSLFVSPHTDDAALSCGGLIVTLRDEGTAVDIVTIFSGSGPLDRLTPYQRLALGFGSQTRWDTTAPTEPAEPVARAEPVAPADDPVPSPFEVMELRRREDRAYARLVGASVRHLDLPDAVFRDYRGDEELLADPKPGDRSPTEELRAAVCELRPDRVFVPLAVGSHVDHRLARRAAIDLMVAGDMAPEIVRFYEDFPYAHNHAFDGPNALDAEFARHLPASLVLEPEVVDVAAAIDRKIAGLTCYASQLGRLFGGDDPMARAVRERAAFLATAAGTTAAERYWWPVPRTRDPASS